MISGTQVFPWPHGWGTLHRALGQLRQFTKDIANFSVTFRRLPFNSMRSCCSLPALLRKPSWCLVVLHKQPEQEASDCVNHGKYLPDAWLGKRCFFFPGGMCVLKRKRDILAIFLQPGLFLHRPTSTSAMCLALISLCRYEADQAWF